MADLEKQLKESEDKILFYKHMFRRLMQEWQGNPKLKKYRDWAKEAYDKVNDIDNLSSGEKINEMDSYVKEKSNEASRKNIESDFEPGKEDFNAIGTSLTNLWKWLKKKKEIKDLKDKQSSLPKKCGKPRVGHGSEGLPCQCNLGKDNCCQHHGPATAIV